MDFNSSITQAAAKSMEHLSEFIFISMGNLTLAHRDAYMGQFRTGIKHDTLIALRTAPLHIPTLFPHAAIKKAEEDIAHFESKSQPGSSRNKGWYHPYIRSGKRSDSMWKRPAWKTIGKRQFKKGKGRSALYSSRPAKGQLSYKWQLLCKQVTGMTAGREQGVYTQRGNGHFCKLSCCKSCTYYTRAFPKERNKSRVSRLLLSERVQIKM